MFSQQSKNAENPIIIESNVKKHSSKTGKLAAVGALIWKENFEGTGSTFPPNGITTSSKDAIDKGFQHGDSTQSNKGQIFKVPAHSSFAFTNDDVCNCNKHQDEIILPIINFSGTSGAIFRFSAYFNRVLQSESAKVYVEVSSAWILIAEIAPDQKWKDYEVLISNGSIINPRFKFVYSDDSTWASGLAIDDIEIYEPVSTLDLRLDSLTVNTETVTDFYKKIPKSQASALFIETNAKATNISKKTAPNTFVTTVISGQNKASERSFLGNLAAVSAKDAQTFSKYSLANGSGNYSLTTFLHSDSVDSDNINDTVSFDLQVTDTVYSRIDQQKANRGFWYGPSKNYDILSLFDVTSKVTASSISIYLHEETNIGDSIDVLIFSEFLQDVVKDSFPQINENIQLKKEHIGNWVTFNIPQSILKAGTYFVGIRTHGKKVVLGVSDNPVKNGLVLANIGTGFGPVDYLPFLNLNVVATPCPAIKIVSTIKKSNCNAKDGQIVLNVSGGKPAYRYQWGKNGSYSSLSAINGVEAGVYQVTVTDSLGCSASSLFALSDTSNLSTSLDSLRNEKCFGDSLGYLRIKILGGVSPYKIEWNNKSSDSIRTKLTSGNYQVTVSDSSGNGCKSILSFQVLGPYDSLKLTAVEEHNKCFVDENGAIKIKVFGGFGTYKYSWSSTSKNESSLSSLKTGKYQLTVSDGHLCVIEDSFEVKGADSLGMSGIVSDTGGTASVLVSIVGGSPSYSFVWKGPDSTGFVNPGTKDLYNLIERGRYILTTTDSLGCTVIDTFIVDGKISVKSISNNRKIGVYPNPSRGEIKLRIEPEGDIDVLILDEMGRKVQGIKSYRNRSIFLNEGLYFFQLEENGVYLNTIKVLIIN